jgi:putative oxidoreductase
VSKSSTSPIRFSWDAFLQRLFSTFPNSWPGVGLLLLRVCLGVAPIYFGIAGLSGTRSEPITLAQKSIAAVGAIFLLAGLWTPVMGTLAALDQIWIALLVYSPGRQDAWIHIFLAILAVSSDARPRRMVDRCSSLREEALRYRSG